MSERFIEVDGKKIRVVEGGGGRPVVFLHGWSFNADDWVNSGVFPTVSQEFRVYAVDMPYGVKSKSEKFRAPRPEYARFLRRILDVLGLVDPPLVGPSASGEVVLWYVAQGLPTRGAVVIGPVGLVPELVSAVAKTNVPILAVWGERDNVSPPSNADLLVGNVEKVVIKDAGHAAYLDKPSEFVKIILDFLRRVA
ncbi:MAG: alpha/beta hydrolase [Pyrobaculum sp.]